MISLIIAATLTLATPQDSVPQLREDNIKEIVSLMTIDEKCSLIIGVWGIKRNVLYRDKC